MKKLNILFAVVAATLSTPALAMPEQVSPGWWDRMAYRIQVMAENNGFCRHNTSWICS